MPSYILGCCSVWQTRERCSTVSHEDTPVEPHRGRFVKCSTSLILSTQETTKHINRDAESSKESSDETAHDIENNTGDNPSNKHCSALAMTLKATLAKLLTATLALALAAALLAVWAAIMVLNILMTPVAASSRRHWRQNKSWLWKSYWRGY